MTIAGEREPRGGRDIIHDELARRRRDGSSVRSLDGPIQTSAPLAVYFLSYEQACTANPLSQAKLCGWRYPVVGGAASGLALLRKTDDGLTYAGLVEGDFVDLVLNVTLRAEMYFGAHRVAFRARLLEIPSLEMCLLWLLGPRGKSWFLAIVDGAAGTTLLTESDLETSIRTAIEARAIQEETLTDKLVEEPQSQIRYELRLKATGELASEMETIVGDAVRSSLRQVGLVASSVDMREAASDIVLIDASGKNAAALVDVGRCQALGKSVVLIVDDETAQTVDLGEVDHLVYPRDLRYGRVVAFQDKLVAKLWDLIGARQGRD